MILKSNQGRPLWGKHIWAGIQMTSWDKEGKELGDEYTRQHLQQMEMPWANISHGLVPTSSFMWGKVMQIHLKGQCRGSQANQSFLCPFIIYLVCPPHIRNCERHGGCRDENHQVSVKDIIIDSHDYSLRWTGTWWNTRFTDRETETQSLMT